MPLAYRELENYTCTSESEKSFTFLNKFHCAEDFDDSDNKKVSIGVHFIFLFTSKWASDTFSLTVYNVLYNSFDISEGPLRSEMAQFLIFQLFFLCYLINGLNKCYTSFFCGSLGCLDANDLKSKDFYSRYRNDMDG